VTPFFKAQLKLRFAPLLRAHGFGGSGLTFRRFANPVIQVVHVQGARAGDSCCVELGVHLAFLPTAMEDFVDPKRIPVQACEFRRRLAPDGADDQWWSYGETERDSASSVDQLMATLEVVGLTFLNRHLVYPGSFGLVTPESLRNREFVVFPGPTTLPRAALTMARISAERAMPAQARAFISVGLEELARTPGVGIGIERQLRDLGRLLPEAG
jgi:hypothetical protein